jgi:hypothetical protein
MCADKTSSQAVDSSPMPWAGWPDEVGCNFAGGHLVHNLAGPITIEGRVHAETLMTAAGAVAGWGAQQSLLSDSEGLQQAQSEGRLYFATLSDGRRMLFGEAINEMLVSNDPKRAPRCVWNWILGTALGHGMDGSNVPNLLAMFAHVAKELGGSREGFPSTQESQPIASARQILDRVLPLAVQCLTGEISEITKSQNFRVEHGSYQIVTAWAAAKILSSCCSVLPPHIALTIGMEAAIYASKCIE